MITDYRTVHAASLDRLDEKVISYLQKGYTLYGSPLISPNGVYQQTVIREEMTGHDGRV